MSNVRNARTFSTRVKGFEDVRQSLQDAKRLLVPGRRKAYDVTWSAASSAPAIGSGTLIGTYSRDGYRCMVDIFLQFAADTTPGSGLWAFSLPPLARRQLPANPRGLCGSALVRDAGTPDFYAGAAVIETSDQDVVRAYIHGETAACGAGVPITWGDGDRLMISIFYDAAAPKAG